MYRLTMTLAVAALIAAGAAACSKDSPTALGDPVDVSLIALDDFGFMQPGTPRQQCATGPGTCFATGNATNRSYLGTLVQQAYQKLLAEQGQAAADAAFATLWKLHQDAFALRATDHDAFVAAMQAAFAVGCTCNCAARDPKRTSRAFGLEAGSGDLVASRPVF